MSQSTDKNHQSFAETRLAPFRIPNFRKLFVAQSVSMVGSWMQELAKSWIVLNLIGTSASIGALMFAAAVPNLLFGSFGGVIADRWGAKKILLITQMLLATLAFALGMLVFSGHVKFIHLVIFAVLEGLVFAFDIPAFNLVTPQIVPKAEFQQALAINTVNFHLSRTLGPAIAGLIMGSAGPSAVFWINAVSFFGIVFVIASLPLKTRAQKEAQSVGAPPVEAAASSGHVKGPAKGSMREVFVYLRHHPLFLRIVLQLLALMMLIFPLLFTVVRVFLQKEFGLTAQQYGLGMAVAGIGALVGSLSFLIWSPKNPIKALPYGVTGLVLFFVLLSRATTYHSAVAILALMSVSMNLTMSALMVTVQLKVEDRFRGRVSALIGMSFAALSPMMGIPLGLVADAIGTRQALLVFSSLFGVISLILAIRSRGQDFTTVTP